MGSLGSTNKPGVGVGSRQSSASVGLDRAAGGAPILFAGYNDGIVIFVLFFDGLYVEVVSSSAVDVVLDGVVEGVEELDRIGNQFSSASQIPWKG